MQKIFNNQFPRLIVALISVLFIFGPLIHTVLASGNESEKSAIDPLVQKADQLMSEERFDRAIPYLEKAYEHSHDESIRGKLVTAYEQSAARLSKIGLTNDALAMLEKAGKLHSVLDPKHEAPSAKENAVDDRELVHVKQYIAGNEEGAAKAVLAEERARILFNEAVKSFEQKQFGLARGQLQEGLQYSDKNYLSYELLGDIEYYSQNLAAAKAAYENSYKLEKTDRVAEKIKKLSGEIKIETRLSEYLDEHFIIRYKRKEEFQGSEIREYLRDSYKTISKDFGHYLNFKTVVMLYGKSDYQSISSIPHWSGALFDGKIRIPAYDAKISRDRFKKLIQHELTHVFITDISNNHCPVWLHEGLAEYEENKIVPVNLRLYRLALADKKTYSAEELEKGVGDEKDELRAYVFYQQSFVIAQSLIDQYKMVSVKKMLQEMAKGASFDDAFSKIYSISFSDYVKTLDKTSDSKEKKT